MAKRSSKEYSISDYLTLLLSPSLSLISGYIYLLTRVDRDMFGLFIGDHISNFFGTALAMYLATAMTSAIEKNVELDMVKNLAVFMQVTCAVALIWININFEVWEGNPQMAGDMMAAIVALAVTWVNTRYSFGKLFK